MHSTINNSIKWKAHLKLIGKKYDYTTTMEYGEAMGF
jgi:hypothetical protein